MYPRSGFWFRGTSECALVPVVGTGNILMYLRSFPTLQSLCLFFLVFFSFDCRFFGMFFLSKNLGGSVKIKTLAFFQWFPCFFFQKARVGGSSAKTTPLETTLSCEPD